VYPKRAVTVVSTDPDSDSGSSAEEGADARRDIDSVLAAVARAPAASPARFGGIRLPEPLRDAASQVAAAHASPDVPAQGDVVGDRYRIERRVGAGGMGVVFAATQLATGRTVALKWMTFEARYRSEAERAHAFQRFAREAQVTARIRHPHVVDVLDASRDPETPYLVMEFLEGGSLRALLDREGGLPFARALELLLPILDAVAEAHRHGVVHRDLKPDNVFLVPKGGALVPKVLDFGVSRLAVGDGNEASLTRTGTVLGTPAYMPLEQLRGQGDVDARTDIYALGVLFYEMLSGRRPFDARNAPDYAALLASERPTPLSRHRPELRGAREAAIMRALNRAPEDRYPDVPAFRKALLAASTSALRARPTGWLLAVALPALVGLVFALQPSASPLPAAQLAPSAAAQHSRAPASPPASPATVQVPPAPEPSAHEAAASPPVAAELPDPARAPVDARTAKRPRQAPALSAPEASRAPGGAVPASPTALRADDFADLPARPAARPVLAPTASPSLSLDRNQF
jgi:eukaryotic-like serine/threonine-protein kinase